MSHSFRPIWFALFCGLLLVVGTWLWWRPAAEPTPAAKPRAENVKSAPAAPATVPPPEPAVPPSDPGRAEVRPLTAASQVPPEVSRTVEANAVPGRILFLDFMLDGNGLRLVGAAGTAGRAKPTGPRQGVGLVHYEVYDAGDRLALTGSVEDPTRRRVEYPAATDDGRIQSTVIFSAGGPLDIRLPGESTPARLVVYRDRNPLAPTPQGRELLGDFSLRARP